MRVEYSKDLIRKGISTISQLKKAKIRVEKDDKKISYKDAKPGKIDVNEFKKLFIC